MTQGKYGLLNNLYSLKRTTFVFVLMCSFKDTTQRPYTAAVVEYVPKRDFNHLPRQIILENTKEYVNLIEQAAEKKADIIVFPENGLTTSEVILKVSQHLQNYAIVFPLLSEDAVANPCDNASQHFHKVFVDLSCAAKQGNIFVVINLAEKEAVDEDGEVFNMYSTNYVFNRQGTVIKKYRKTHLHNDLSFSHGTQEMETFETDFGVRFGLLIGADILYKKPAVELVSSKNAVKDVIYSTIWSSEIPFLNGLSIQQGYAKANNINLLAASLNDPLYNSSGSGIYFSQERDNPECFGFGLGKSKLLIRNISDVCDGSQNNAIYEMQSKLHNQYENIAVEDMQNYTFEFLDFPNDEGVIEGCSKVNSFCCYNISVKNSITQQSQYNYKIASFHGVRHFGSRVGGKTIGVIVCALVTCLENTTSCFSMGSRCGSPPEPVFNNILINVTYSLQNSSFQPTTLSCGLRPAINYSYSANSNKYIVETRNPESTLVSLGIFGRIYSYDTVIAGSIKYGNVMNMRNTKNSASYLEYYTILITGTIVVVSEFVVF